MRELLRKGDGFMANYRPKPFLSAENRRMPKQARGNRVSLVERLEKEIEQRLQVPHEKRQYYLIELLQDALDQIRRQ